MNKQILKEKLFKQKYGFDIYIVKTILATIAVEVIIVSIILLILQML